METEVARYTSLRKYIMPKQLLADRHTAVRLARNSTAPVHLLCLPLARRKQQMNQMSAAMEILDRVKKYHEYAAMFKTLLSQWIPTCLLVSSTSLSLAAVTSLARLLVLLSP